MATQPPNLPARSKLFTEEVGGLICMRSICCYCGQCGAKKKYSDLLVVAVLTSSVETYYFNHG